MGLAQTVRSLSEAKYLEHERRAGVKSEFMGGEALAMAGGTRTHSLIASNLIRALSQRLQARGCEVHTIDLRLKIEATGLYTYPDVSVVCGPPQFLDDTEDTLLNPSLLAEVLSDSTEAYDRVAKFDNYRQIPSLQMYLLVSQTTPRIEQFTRQRSGEWLWRSAAGLAARLELRPLATTLALARVFAQVKFPPVGARRR